MIQRNADGILVIDHDGIVRFCNPAAERLFDQEAAHLIGQVFGFPLITDENTELDIINPRTGAVQIAEMRVVEIEWQNAPAYLATLRDVTARKLLDAERMEREKIAVALEKERELRSLKERFLTMMSHELRTPLALIHLSYDMLKQYGARASEEERQGYLDNIHVQVEHLTDMIHDVLTISRADSVMNEFSPEPTDMIGFCQRIVDDFHHSYFQSHALMFGCEQHSLHAAVDRRLLRQAISNLISNALKYSPPDSPVMLTLRGRGRHFEIAVEDHGIGIPPDDLPRLFEPFHRGGNVETIPGTGLGLTIVEQIVKAHRGRIDVQSTVGVGTTFTLVLPALVEVRAET
jgi:signal transduction histidine kinase